MFNQKKQSATINMPTKVNHFGWFCDDKDFGNKYKPYQDWIEQKNHINWCCYESGMLDNDVDIMQRFCDIKKLNIQCYYDKETDGIYLIEKQQNERN